MYSCFAFGRGNSFATFSKISAEQVVKRSPLCSIALTWTNVETEKMTGLAYFRYVVRAGAALLQNEAILRVTGSNISAMDACFTNARQFLYARQNGDQSTICWEIADGLATFVKLFPLPKARNYSKH